MRSLRAQLLFQLRLDLDINEYRISNAYELLKQKPFLFSVESETQYFFLVTDSKNSDEVYLFDENKEIVESTSLSFLDYMKEAVHIYAEKSLESNMLRKGELLPFENLGAMRKNPL